MHHALRNSGNSLTDMFLFLSLLGVVVAIFGGRFLARKFDRERISENIETHGGKVIEILRSWGSYDVSYVTARGARLRATCNTSMWNGVYG
jgi:hypothetical protein